MQTAEIRRRWLQFFADRGHAVVPSASLVSDEPSLLLVGAGMVPFVPYMKGEKTPPWPRATSVQKCVRTVDIEEVGKTTRHGSFFQMNGNFSFGDYFKEGAITFAWELLTSAQWQGGFGFDPQKLWVSVYHDDDEAQQLWQRIAGMPQERIQRRGMKDNYWSMGVPGPCGPCSEIFYDRGPAYGPEGGPEVNEERYLEVWNLVFMQFERGSGGAKDNYPILGELPRKNVDTGMGLERVACLLQGKDNLYEIDEVYPVIARACEMAGIRYGDDPQADVRLRIVADHIRTSLMLVGDGVVPSNEGRGYVLRRIMRRAMRAMRLLGVDKPSTPELLPVSKDVMAQSYPELEKDFDRISQVTYAEEETFASTLKSGTVILDTAVQQAKAAAAAPAATSAPSQPASSWQVPGQVQSQPPAAPAPPVGATPILPGEKVFALHDTYGFPFDLTVEMAAEQGVAVDEEGFRRLMNEQRGRAKADAAAKKTGGVDLSVYRGLAEGVGSVEFTGYDQTQGQARVLGLIRDGESVRVAHTDEKVEIILDETPFYAESGGQLADHGTLSFDGGAQAQVHDVQKPLPGLIVHRCTVTAGEVQVDASVHASIDVTRRRAVSRAHTATHMVHQGFRDALGDSVHQAGSENSPGRLRFDFTASGGVPPQVLHDVEQQINEMLVNDMPVQAEYMNQSDAIASGALALFGEKYGDIVRVVSIGDTWSRELCGGTHTQHSGQLGLVKILGEASVGSGVRRVEALVGVDAYSYLAREHVLVGQLTEALKVRPDELPERVGSLLTKLKDAERELDQLRAGQVLAAAGQLASSARDVFGVSFVGHQDRNEASADDLRKLALEVRNRLGDQRPAVVAVAGVTSGRPFVIVTVNELGRQWRLKAGELVKLAAGVLGGGGGGKDDLAQGGGTNPGQLGSALQAVEQAVGRTVTQ